MLLFSLFPLFLLLFQVQAYSNPAEPAPLASASHSFDILEGDPSAIVHNCVNIITGDYIDMQEDLVVPGSDPLFLSRFYCSSEYYGKNCFNACNFNHDMILEYSKEEGEGDEDPTRHVVLRDGFGRQIPYRGKTHFRLPKEVFYKRITNTSSQISGRSHLKNRNLFRRKEKKEWEATDGSGTSYIFDHPHDLQQKPIKKCCKSNGNIL